jgi:hypothetical protein
VQQARGGLHQQPQHEVKSLKAVREGLDDLHGNVKERFFYIGIKKKKKGDEKEKKDEMFAGRSASKGSDAKVPDKYLSYTKSLSDASTTVLEVRPITPPYMDITGNGNNMLSFSFPNNPDQFLLSDTVYLSGSIQINIASDDEKDTFANLKPAIPKLFTILQTHRFRVGGRSWMSAPTATSTACIGTAKPTPSRTCKSSPMEMGPLLRDKQHLLTGRSASPCNFTIPSCLEWLEPPRN